MFQYLPMKKISSFVLLLVLTMPLTAICAEKSKPVTQSIRVAVIPFHVLLPEEGSQNTVMCPVCGGAYSGGEIIKGAERIVEELFVEKLKAFKELQIIPTERVAGAHRRVAAESLKKPLLKVMMKVGGELKADILAIGYVYRYKERVGYDYSAEHPASVAFEIHFINVKDSRTIWRGIFDKTQKSLMEDVFQLSSFYKGGGKWLTAGQLSKLGIDEIFQSFPGFEQ